MRIARRLSDPRYENRLRMTLGHEYGHVWFHAPLWRNSKSGDEHRRSAVDLPSRSNRRCSRNRLDGVSGGVHRRRAADAQESSVLVGARDQASEAKEPPLDAGRDLGSPLIERVINGCHVSPEAARIRLLRCNCSASDERWSIQMLQISKRSPNRRPQQIMEFDR